MRHPELLIPAGDLETLKIAVMYGADAVYVGGEIFSLRAKAKNFTTEDLREGIAFAHAHDVCVYIAFNIYAFSEELSEARAYLEKLREIKPDAFIVSDLAVFRMIREVLPDVPVHISTQWNNTNYETFLFWYELGVRKVVCARELSLAEIKEIRARVPDDMQIECFVHGAMCIAYSGKCRLSDCMTGRDSNHGACTHPCRWKFALCDMQRDAENDVPDDIRQTEENSVPDDIRQTEENAADESCGTRAISDGYAYFMNSKDLCMIEHIPDLIDAGVDSFKIEGRMKTVLYVATVARAYRLAIDAYRRSPEEYEEKLPVFTDELSKGTYRDYTTGFFYGKPSRDAQIYDNNTYIKNYTFLGYAEAVTEDGLAVITQRNKFFTGDTVEVMKPDGRNLTVTVRAIYDAERRPMESCPHPQQKLFLDVGQPLDVYDVLRRRDE